MHHSIRGRGFVCAALFLLLSGNVAQAEMLLHEGFENGLVDWDVSACWYGQPAPPEPEYSAIQYNGCVPYIDNTYSTEGQQSFKSQFHPSDPQTQQGTYYDHAISSARNVWLRIDQRFEGPGGVGSFVYSPIQTKHIMLRGATPGLAVWIVNQWGAPNPILVANNAPVIDVGNNHFQNVGSYAVADGEWNCFVAHIDRGTQGESDGVLELWVNNTKVIEYTGLPLETSEDVCSPTSTCAGQQVAHSFDLVRLFQQYGSGDRYQDNLTVATHPLSCADAPPAPCTTGETRSCYSAYIGTRDVGVCHSGIQTCNAGSWGPCDGMVGPTNENCNTSADENCDGNVNEGCTGQPPVPNSGDVEPVINLQVASVDGNSVTLSFTEVANGLGAAADYEVRFVEGTMSWGSATIASSGTCSNLVGTVVGQNRSCTITGLDPQTAYSFQLVAYRGTLNQDAVFGALSNVVSATTLTEEAPPAQNPPPTPTTSPNGQGSGDVGCENGSDEQKCAATFNGTFSGCMATSGNFSALSFMWTVLLLRRKGSLLNR